MAVVNGLYGSKGPTKYDVLELEETEEGILVLGFVMYR